LFEEIITSLLKECSRQSDERNKLQMLVLKNFSFCTFFHQLNVRLSTWRFSTGQRSIYQKKIGQILKDKHSGGKIL